MLPRFHYLRDLRRLTYEDAALAAAQGNREFAQELQEIGDELVAASRNDDRLVDLGEVEEEE